MKSLSLCTVVFSMLFQSLAVSAQTSRYCLSLRDDPSTTMVIGWDGSDGAVHYDIIDHGTNAAAYPNVHPSDRSTSHKGQNRYFARLTGLTPNTVYYFVVESAGATSLRMKFQTLSDDPNTPVSFISGADSRDGFSLLGFYIEDCPSGDCLAERREGNELVSKIRPDFVGFNGDMVQNQITSDITDEWNTWFDDWQLTRSSDGKMYPLVLAPGNHEDSEDFYNLYDIPQEEYYSLNIHNGLLRLYSLNSELDACSSTNQLNWLTSDLQMHTGTASDPIWKAAQYHAPIYAMANGYGLDQEKMNCWAPLFRDYNVSLAMESHSHTTKWTYPCVPNSNSDDFVVDNTAGTVFVGEGQWGAPHRPLDFPGGDQKSYVRDQDVFDNFFFIRVSADSINIQSVKFENVNAVASISDDDLGSYLPAGVTTWNPAGGNAMVITKSQVGLGNEIPKPLKVKNIYPIPSKDMITIEFGEPLKNAQIDIFNSLGQYCISVDASGKEKTEIEIEKLCTGVNYLYLRDQNGHVESHRIVKSK